MADRVLRTEPVADPDGLYQLLVEAHRDLSAEQSQLLNSKLVLVRANPLGDPEVVAAALAAARDGLASSAPASAGGA
jgi:hypothetical protein